MNKGVVNTILVFATIIGVGRPPHRSAEQPEGTYDPPTIGSPEADSMIRVEVMSLNITSIKLVTGHPARCRS